MSVGHYENFPVASRLVPAALRPAVVAIYRFARSADDIADEGDASDARVQQAIALIDGAPLAGELPLELIGTAFQQRVWRALRGIPSGETTTYAELAERIGAPGAARAVGTACGQNPVAVAVPCHRVVRHDGSLGGYRWGLARKRVLMAREQRRAG